MSKQLSIDKIDEKNRVKYSPKYIYYAAVVFGIINLLDIFSSNAGPLTKSYVIEEFFLSKGIAENIAYSQYSLLGIIGMPLMLLALSMRYLADKRGRKFALIVNIIGMTIGAALILISENFFIFMIGYFFSGFFLTADIQLLMITEESPRDKRSQFLAFARIIGLVGAILVPFSRSIFLAGENPNWRGIYYAPVAIGIIATLLAIFTIKESSVYLTMKKQNEFEESQSENEVKPEKEGFFKTLKKAKKVKNFKIIVITTIIGALGMLGGMAEREFMEPFLSATFSLSNVNLIYYIRYLISMVVGVIIGVVRDKMGRKAGLLATLIIQSVFVGLFFLFVSMNQVILAGLAYGIFIYAIFMNPVTAGLIVNELSPTKYRGTVITWTGLISFGLIMVWMIIQGILVLWIDFAWLIVIATVPFSLVAIILLFKFVPETKGVDLSTIEE